MPCWRQKKKKKPNVDYISSTEGNWEVIYSLLFYETRTVIRALVGKIYFPHPVVLHT